MIVMKRLIAGILMLVMILCMSIAFSACNKESQETGIATESSVGDNDENNEDSDAEDETDAEAEDLSAADIVKSFEPDAEDTIGHDLPLQIEKVELYKDGSVRIVPTDDLKKNELGDSKASSLMPFAESGEIKDIYLMRIGNGGYRTIVALTDEGTVSAINTRALIEDYIIAVMDNLGGRDSFTSIEQEESEDAFSIVGKTEEGDDVILDPVILNEDGEVQPAE